MNRVLTVLVLLILGCESLESDADEKNTTSLVAMQLRDIPSEIQSVRGVFAQGSERVNFNLNLNNGLARGEYSLRVGQWNISVDAFSANGTKLYTGNGSVTVNENQVSQVHLTLEPVSGTVIIHTSFRLLISSINISPGSNNALISWGTNLKSKSNLSYRVLGTDSFNTISIVDSSKSFSYQLSALNQSTQYQFYIQSATASQTAVSDTVSFMTATTTSGSVDSAKIYWVGHSLINHRVDHNNPNYKNLPEQMEIFANSQQLLYREYQLVYAGSPLSWNWAWNDLTDMPADRLAEVSSAHTEMTSNPGKYDVLVMTEGVPFTSGTIAFHQPSFFARKFFGLIKNVNPNARVYLYESWANLYALDSTTFTNTKPQYYNWETRIDEDRLIWERIADEAGQGTAQTPANYQYRFSSTDPGQTSITGTIYIIPAGQALKALHRRLKNPLSSDNWVLSANDTLSPNHLVDNGYRNWPRNWPAASGTVSDAQAQSIISGLSRFRPAEDFDDIHLSQLGIYYVSLVHYATIYRRSPVGLPNNSFVPQHIARAMQEIVWDVVRNDSRSGVN